MLYNETYPERRIMKDRKIKKNIREVGEIAEETGRSLQTTAKLDRKVRREDVRNFREDLQYLSNALRIYEKMIPKKR